jgi:uncharacterized protein YndB with AHSA1/START domain
MTTKTGTHRLEVTTTSDFDIVMTRSFNAPAQLLFDAWTKPEHMRRWFGRPDTWEMDVCDIDLRVGGKYRWHMRHRETGEGMGIYGEYRKIEAPTLLANTEIFEEPYFEEMGAGSENTLEFIEKDGVTTQVGTSVYKTKAQRDRVLQTGMEEGAEESFERLDALLAELTKS